MKTDRARIIDTFTGLVAIDSPSFDERQMADHIIAKLDQIGIAAYEDKAGEIIGGSCGNIYAYSEGDICAPPLLFAVHMDTVEPSKGKKAVLLKDGTIKSGGDTVLGADDMAGITAILEALTVIKEKKLPHRPLEFIFSVAEEPYCRGIRHFDFNRLCSKEAYVLDLTGPVGTAAFRAPTIFQFTITIQGRASHAGFAPEEGINSILVAMSAISKLPSGHTDDDTTLNIGRIEGGTATNVVPEKCIVKGEIRSLSHETAEAHLSFVKEQFKAVAGEYGALVSFDVFTASRAYITPPGHPVIKRFKTACEALNLPADIIKTFGGSDNNILAEHGISGIVLACAMNSCHSCDEYTSVDELQHISELTVELMTAQE